VVYSGVVQVLQLPSLVVDVVLVAGPTFLLSTTHFRSCEWNQMERLSWRKFQSEAALSKLLAILPFSVEQAAQLTYTHPYRSCKCFVRIIEGRDFPRFCKWNPTSIMQVTSSLARPTHQPLFYMERNMVIHKK
jgi:hypothetical protein